MGADLYLSSRFDANHQRWKQEFDRLVAVRDCLAQGTREYAETQQQVEQCYEQMYAQGYFRDSYNDWNLLSQFELSWWRDVIPMLDSENYLPVAGVKRLLGMLKEREAGFETSLTVLPPEDRRYFQQRYQELQRFLQQATELDEPVYCSL